VICCATEHFGQPFGKLHNTGQPFSCRDSLCGAVRQLSRRCPAVQRVRARGLGRPADVLHGVGTRRYSKL